MSSLSFSGSLVISSHLSVFLHLVFAVNPLVISHTGVSVSVAEETEPLLQVKSLVLVWRSAAHRQLFSVMRRMRCCFS